MFVFRRPIRPVPISTHLRAPFRSSAAPHLAFRRFDNITIYRDTHKMQQTVVVFGAFVPIEGEATRRGRRWRWRTSRSDSAVATTDHQDLWTRAAHEVGRDPCR